MRLGFNYVHMHKAYLYALTYACTCVCVCDAYDILKKNTGVRWGPASGSIVCHSFGVTRYTHIATTECVCVCVCVNGKMTLVVALVLGAYMPGLHKVCSVLIQTVLVCVILLCC